MAIDPFGLMSEDLKQQTWTREPFDRIIVGHAAVHARPLVTKDRTIYGHYLHAFWVDGPTDNVGRPAQP